MEFKFPINDIFKTSVVEINHTLIPPGFSGDRRSFWDAIGKVSEVINAMGEASAAAQGLTKPITTAERLRNSEQKIYLLVDKNAGNGRGAVTGMLKIGQKGLYVFDRNGQHYQVSPPCVLDFYIHESRQRTGLGKRLFEHMLQNESIEPVKLAIDRPSEKFLGFLRKHYSLDNPVKQMNNYVVFDGFFPTTPEKNGNTEDAYHSGGTPGKKQSANGLQTTSYTSPWGRYGAPKPPCSMGQIIHNQSSTIPKNPEPTGVVSVRSAPETNYHGAIGRSPQNPANVSQSAPNIPYQTVQQQQNPNMAQMQNAQYQTSGVNQNQNNYNQYQQQQQQISHGNVATDPNAYNEQLYQNNQHNMYASNLQQQQFQNNMQNAYMNQSGDTNLQGPYVIQDQGQTTYQNTPQFVNSGMQNLNQMPPAQPTVTSTNTVQYPQQTQFVTNAGPYVQQKAQIPYASQMSANVAPQDQMVLQNNTQQNVDNSQSYQNTYQQAVNQGTAGYVQPNPQQQQMVQQNYYQQEPLTNQMNNYQNQQIMPQSSYPSQSEQALSSTQFAQSSPQNTQSYTVNATNQQPYGTQSNATATNQLYLTQSNVNATNQQPYVTQSSVNATDQQPYVTQSSVSAINQQPYVTQSSVNANHQQPYVTQSSVNTTNQQPYVAQSNQQYSNQLQPTMMYNNNVPGVTVSDKMMTQAQTNNQAQLSPSVTQSVPNTMSYIQPQPQAQPQQVFNMTNQMSQPNMNTANTTMISPQQSISQPVMAPKPRGRNGMQSYSQMDIPSPRNLHTVETKPTMSQPNTNAMNERNTVQQSQTQVSINQSQNMNDTSSTQHVSSAPYARPQSASINQNVTYSTIPQHMEGNQLNQLVAVKETRVHDAKGDMPSHDDEMFKNGYPPQLPKAHQNTRPYVLSVPGR